jgi:acyl-CoA thioester hydrolase
MISEFSIEAYLAPLKSANSIPHFAGALLQSPRMKQAMTRAQVLGLTSKARVRVRYAETDQMGISYYANYFIWFEVGRNQHCIECGFSYRDMEKETGLYLIVADAQCRYKTPARYEDELIIKTRINELTKRTVRFIYEIERADGEIIATGETLHVLINQQGRPSSLPEKYLTLLRAEQPANESWTG